VSSIAAKALVNDPAIRIKTVTLGSNALFIQAKKYPLQTGFPLARTNRRYFAGVGGLSSRSTPNGDRQGQNAGGVDF